MPEEKKLTPDEELFLISAYNNDAATVERLLREGKVDVNVTNNENSGALHDTVYLGHRDTLKVLLRYKPKLDVRTVTGLTPLVIAAMHHREEEGILLLEAGADANYLHDNGTSAMWDAAHAGLKKLAAALIKHGSHINALKDGEKSPVILAAMGGSLEVLQMLEAKGADIHYTDKDGLNALRVSLSNRHPDVFRYLLARTPRAEVLRQGASLMAAATFADNPSAIRTLAEMGVKLSEFPTSPSTLLHSAAIFDLPAAAEALMELGIPLAPIDYNGRTAREEAVEESHLKVVNAIDRHQHKLDVEEIVAKTKQGVSQAIPAPERATFVMKKRPKPQFT